MSKKENDDFTNLLNEIINKKLDKNFTNKLISTQKLTIIHKGKNLKIIGNCNKPYIALTLHRILKYFINNKMLDIQTLLEVYRNVEKEIKEK